MNDSAKAALLPNGLRDILPLDAEFEADVVSRVTAHFAAQGYDRVKPPLIEFEDTLLADSNAAMAKQCFRVMDPVTQRMMGLRPDMTPQVARIARTRLAGSPRPLRLSYAGQVLRVKGTQLRPERQFGQAGIELIGADCPEADAEVAILAAEALVALGVPGVSVDLSLPTLVPAILDGLNVDQESLRGSLDHKDAAAVLALGGVAAPLLSALLKAAGPAERALSILAALELPPAAAAERDRLAQVVALIKDAAPEVTITIDPVENRGFEYHSGISFTLFAQNIAGELGRGGRYMAGGCEPSTGATLFLDTIVAALPGPEPVKRIFVPAGAPRAYAQALRAQGWITVAGLRAVDDNAAEAKRMGCGHVLLADGVKSVE
ncbi:ATP phosphoribosyltransferase regulatory subunit [Magnetospirillum sp. 64-120]|uniref:ATP phosphoribosyltransferase regulatory subunit n=1 Tax=Magnetospirillum sp. 64-120 TaxID=1895778 RepID=UPI000926AE67|nr:ATP phosphoribosyltransferase regulatory subunit [Magnetospirillum sp. 64-120]OJX74814.1 MAG: ATP phosphoribosyltransferase regulatory subunit [Magnetospirillum sp. 64-120]